MSSQAIPPSPGRPRGFVPAAALQAALAVFWRQGYEAASLDDLTAAMGLSRSSFYACFGSKHATLLAAVRSYADERFAALATIAGSEPDARAAVRAMLALVAGAEGGEHGCLFVNAVIELAPRDAELAALARAHVARVSALVAAALARAGLAPALAERRAGALLSCAIGATMLRKAGIPAAHVAALLAEADSLLNPQGNTT